MEINFNLNLCPTTTNNATLANVPTAIVFTILLIPKEGDIYRGPSTNHHHDHDHHDNHHHHHHHNHDHPQHTGRVRRRHNIKAKQTISTLRLQLEINSKVTPLTIMMTAIKFMQIMSPISIMLCLPYKSIQR